MPRPPDEVSRDLRAAVLGADHEQAARLAEEYTRAVQTQWEQMSDAERSASRLPKQAQELLTWARDVAAMHHAMAAQHLAALETAHRYLAARANYMQSSL